MSAEVVAPDGTAALLSFEAPYPLLKTTSGIEARDMGGFESSFVQVRLRLCNYGAAIHKMI